jgi:hypothetical protein
MTDAISTQTANVTTRLPVTMVLAVTAETVAAQRLSPVSPLSLLLVSTIHARDKGFGMTDVTSDSGDTGDATPWNTGANRLAQLSQTARRGRGGLIPHTEGSSDRIGTKTRKKPKLDFGI